MLSYCCTINANKSRVSLRSTFSNCHFLFGYFNRLYTHRCNRFKYRIASTRCSVSHTCNAEVSHIMTNKLPRQPTLLTTPGILPPAHRRGRGPPYSTVADGQKFSAVRRLSRRVEKRNFYLPHLHFAPPWGDCNFVKIFCITRLESLGYRVELFARS